MVNGLTRRTLMRAFSAVTAGGASAALAACGAGSTATPGGEGTKTQTPVTLRYVGSFAASNQTTFAGGASKLVELFNEKGTPIRVEPIAPTNNRNEAVMSMITAGDPPDLFHALPRDYHPFVLSLSKHWTNASAGCLPAVGGSAPKPERDLVRAYVNQRHHPL